MAGWAMSWCFFTFFLGSLFLALATPRMCLSKSTSRVLFYETFPDSFSISQHCTLYRVLYLFAFFFFHCKLVNSWEVKDCMLFKISKAWQLYLTRWGLFLQILIKDDRFFLHTAPCKLFTKYSWFYIMCECDWGWAASKWITWSASFLVWLESKKGTHFSLNIFLKSSFNRAADSPLCSHCLNIYPNHCEYFWKPRNMFPNPDFSSQ